MNSFTLFLNLSVVIFGLVLGCEGTELVNNEIKVIIERMVDEIVKQKVSEIQNEFQAVTDNLRHTIDILKQENVYQKTAIEELQKELGIAKPIYVADKDKQEVVLDGPESVADNITDNAVRGHLFEPRLPPTSVLRERRASPGNIAFCAYLSQTQRHLTGEPVRFDKILINDGGGYNSYTGAFTAPLSGVYLFNFHFDTTRDVTIVRLVVDGVNQVDALANQHATSDRQHKENMAGNSAIIHVNHGQAVLVEVYQVADVEVASSETYRLSTFSGILLY